MEDDSSNPIPPERLLILPRTEGISSSDIRLRALVSRTSIQNRKLMLTPGPATILPQNLSGITPVFGRGDPAYQGHLCERSGLGETHGWAG